MLLPLIALLFLTSCRSTTPWAVDRVASGDSKFNSTRLTYPTDDPINGLDIEFLKTHDKLYVYLSVHSVPIPPVKTDPHSSFVYITVGREKHCFEAYRREGGQRLLLPDHAVDFIIPALNQQSPLKIAVSGYSAFINSSEFAKMYKKIEHTPSFENPFHLPF